MTTISDDYGARHGEPGVDKILWEHGRRNFALRAEGLLAIVCPVNDGSQVKGVGILGGYYARKSRRGRGAPVLDRAKLTEGKHGEIDRL